MMLCGPAAPSPFVTNQSLLEAKARARKGPGGGSSQVISEAAAALSVLLQLEDVSAHKG